MGGAEVIKEDLAKFEREIENAIFGPKVLRVHLKVEILNPQNWRQEYKVFCRNESNERLKYAKIDQRKKEVQRNLSIYDNRGNELLTVPSYIVEKALQGICRHYVSEAHRIADIEEKKMLDEIVSSPIDFDIIFSHDDRKNTKEITQKAKERLKRIALGLKKSEEIPPENPYFYINRILSLISPYEDLYIPIVQLEKPVRGEDCFSISYSVENLQEQHISSRWFLLFGSLSISIPLELKRLVPNHIMILSPNGLLFQQAGITGLEGTLIEEKYKDLSKYLDDDMIHFHVSLEDTEIVYQAQSKSVTETTVATDSNSNSNQTTDESTRAKGPEIEFSLGISRNFLQRPSLIRMLIFLMYLSLLIPTLAQGVFHSHISSALLMETMIIEVTILVSIGVYSMDKPFLPEYIATQVMILLVLLIIETSCLYLCLS
jgi:hypothetical protein